MQHAVSTLYMGWKLNNFAAWKGFVAALTVRSQALRQIGEETRALEAQGQNLQIGIKPKQRIIKSSGSAHGRSHAGQLCRV